MNRGLNWWQTVTITSIAAFALLAPILYGMLTGASLIWGHPDEFGYRYFFGLRWLYYSDEHLWLPQGQFTGIFHHLINIALTGFGHDPFSPDAFWHRAIAFYWLSSLVAAVLAIVLLALYIKQLPSPSYAIGAIPIALYPSLGFTHAIDHFVRPDYPAYTTAICIGTAALGARLLSNRERGLSWGLAVALGVLGGIAIGQKVSLVGIPISLALIVLLTYRVTRKLLQRLTIAWAISVATIIALVAGQYLRSVSSIPHIADRIFKFSSGESRPNALVVNWLSDITVRDGYGFAFLFLFLVTAFLLLWRPSKTRLNVAIALSPLFAIGVVFTYVRYTPATIVETANMFVAALLIAMAAKQIAKPKPSEIPSRIRTLTLAGSCVVIAAFLGLRAASYVANLDSGEDKELLDRIRQLPGRTLVLIGPDDPTNLLLAIAKGGWVGWNFDRNGHYGHSLVQQLFPGIDFRLSNSIPDLDLVRDINLDDFDQVIEIADANTSIPATYSRGLRIENVNVSSVVPIGSRIKLLIFRKDSGA